MGEVFRSVVYEVQRAVWPASGCLWLPLAQPVAALEALEGPFIAADICEVFPSKSKGTNPGFALVEPMRAYEMIGINKAGGDVFQIKMPGAASFLHRQEWIKHGTCHKSGGAEGCYLDALALTRAINDSAIGDFFEAHVGAKVEMAEIRLLAWSGHCHAAPIGRLTGRRPRPAPTRPAGGAIAYVTRHVELLRTLLG